MESSISDDDLEEAGNVEERVQAIIQKALGTGDNDLDELTKEQIRWLPRKGWSQYSKEEDLNFVDQGYYQSPYETFMRKHLEHYGYFTGRNASFRSGYQNFNDWQQNYDMRLSGTTDLTPADEINLKKNNKYNAGAGSNDTGTMFSGEGEVPDELLRRTTQLVFNVQAGRKIPSLREPRGLYALTKEPGPQQATRWPHHVQVVCPSINFIPYYPETPEPFYVPTSKEATPAVRSPQMGELVYYNDPGGDCYFMRSRVAGCRGVSRNAILTPRESTDDIATLEFESRFESGNLLKANKITPFDYELTLRTDLYTDRHTQWFFFRVRNMVKNKPYRFTITNLMKPSSLYNHGMKPVYYSEVEAKENKIGWVRRGNDIRYYRNNRGSMAGRTFYSLTWTHTFDHDGDTCYFAHCYPYTYTDLQEYLLKLANDPVRSKFCKQRVLTRTLAGNLVYVLTITYPAPNPEIARTKRAIVITARVHPGETNASWMMKGFLDFLTGNSADAKLLRETFIFKIVPMLNPDGVIVGNYRCSLSGRDLNRNYKSVLKDSFPSVYHTKLMIKKLLSQREVVLYCDLHGHSRKNNIFIYGCENKNNPTRKYRERIFPLMLSKNAPTSFSYESCKYKVQRSKEGTGRVVMFYMGVMNSYTMEATFGGTSLGARKGSHFSTRDLELMGHSFCDTILDYCDPDPSKEQACYIEVQERMRRQLMKKLQGKNIDIANVNLDDYSSELESDTSGSDSSCDDGLPVHLLAIAPKLQRRRKLKSRRDRNNKQIRKTSAPVLPQQEEVKPPPVKSASDKFKVTSRYHQPSKKETRMTGSNNNSAYSEGGKLERASKKVAELRTNKATFVHFSPPSKLTATPYLVNHEKTQLDVKKTQLPHTGSPIKMFAKPKAKYRVEKFKLASQNIVSPTEPDITEEVATSISAKTFDANFPEKILTTSSSSCSEVSSSSSITSKKDFSCLRASGIEFETKVFNTNIKVQSPPMISKTAKIKSETTSLPKPDNNELNSLIKTKGNLPVIKEPGRPPSLNLKSNQYSPFNYNPTNEDIPTIRAHTSIKDFGESKPRSVSPPTVWSQSKLPQQPQCSASTIKKQYDDYSERIKNLNKNREALVKPSYQRKTRKLGKHRGDSHLMWGIGHIPSMMQIGKREKKHSKFGDASVVSTIPISEMQK